MNENRLTPLKAIRAKCVDCCCGSYNEVKQCQSTACSLHPYRLGHNPYISLSEEERARRAENIKNRSSAQEKNIKLPL